MTNPEQLLPVVGAMLCLASAVLLRRAWHRTTRARTLWTIAGWASLALALGPFAGSMGAVVGGIAWLLAFGLCGLAVTLHGRERGTGRTRAHQTGRSKPIEPDQRPRIRWRGWARGSAALLLTLLTADAICAALAGVSPGPAATRFSAAMLMLPLIWAGLVIWTLSDRVLRRPILGMAGALAASGAMIAWSVLA